MPAKKWEHPCDLQSREQGELLRPVQSEWPRAPALDQFALSTLSSAVRGRIAGLTQGLL